MKLKDYGIALLVVWCFCWSLAVSVSIWGGYPHGLYKRTDYMKEDIQEMRTQLLAQIKSDKESIVNEIHKKTGLRLYDD